MTVAGLDSLGQKNVGMTQPPAPPMLCGNTVVD
jgi:hypothetical protein